MFVSGLRPPPAWLEISSNRSRGSDAELLEEDHKAKSVTIQILEMIKNLFTIFSIADNSRWLLRASCKILRVSQQLCDKSGKNLAPTLLVAR